MSWIMKLFTWMMEARIELHRFSGNFTKATTMFVWFDSRGISVTRLRSRPALSIVLEM